MKPPEPPEDYLSGYEYEGSRIALFLSFVITTGIGVVVTRASLTRSAEAVAQRFGWSGAIFLLALLPIIFIITLEVHERIHYRTGLLLGYMPKIYRRYYLKPHVKTPGQWMESRHNIISLLSPLFVINAISASLALTGVHPIVTFAGSASLLINTVSASGDVRGVWDTLSYPDDTLLYFPDSKKRTGFVYFPDTEND